MSAKNTKDYENNIVVIAGAGVSGCSFALSLDSNISVLILEKCRTEEEIGHNWIDGFHISIMPDSPLLKYVDKVGGPHPITFYSPDGKNKLNIKATDKRFDVDRKIIAKKFITDIKEKKNIELLLGAEVIRPIVNENSVTGVVYYHNNSEHQVNCQLLADATGYKGVLRQTLASKFDFPEEIRGDDTFLGFKKYIKNFIPAEKRENKVYLGRHRGVQWINSSPEGYIDLFAGVLSVQDQVPIQDIIKELEQELQNEYGQNLDLTSIRANYGAPIPIRRCVQNFCENGFILLGDAACQCEPITGSGIASGMLAGEIAAKVVNNIYSQGLSFTKINLWPYPKEWISKTGAEYASIDVFRMFLLSLSEAQLNFLVNKKIVQENDLNAVMANGKFKMGVRNLLGRIWRGLRKFKLLLGLYKAIKDGEKIKKLYLNYPKAWNYDNFQNWVAKKNKILKKYISE